jgi:hypothetical protein
MEHIGKYLPFVGPNTKTKKVPIARNPLFYWCGAGGIRTHIKSLGADEAKHVSILTGFAMSVKTSTNESYLQYFFTKSNFLTFERFLSFSSS